MQRLGRGGRGNGTKAIGLYLVEPVYCDGHKRKRVHGAGEDGIDDNGRRPTKRQKKTAAVRESGVVEEGRDGDMISNNLNPTEITDLPMEPTKIERDVGTIPFPSHGSKPGPEFEEEVMDLYINAKSRSICRRAVPNRYFGNHLVGELPRFNIP